MKTIRMFMSFALLTVIGTAALAFEEQSGGSATTPPPATKPASDEKSGLATPDVANKSGNGTEISIPGLGKLGVLPKMDFGLELLYGAAEIERSPDDTQEPTISSDDDDLRVRGTIKHRF